MSRRVLVVVCALFIVSAASADPNKLRVHLRNVGLGSYSPTAQGMLVWKDGNWQPTTYVGLFGGSYRFEILLGSYNYNGRLWIMVPSLSGGIAVQEPFDPTIAVDVSNPNIAQITLQYASPQSVVQNGHVPSIRGWSQSDPGDVIVFPSTCDTAHPDYDPYVCDNDGDTIPDICDLDSPKYDPNLCDCDGDGIRDTCDYDSPSYSGQGCDCDNDGVCDECDPDNPINVNGVPPGCQCPGIIVFPAQAPVKQPPDGVVWCQPTAQPDPCEGNPDADPDPDPDPDPPGGGGDPPGGPGGGNPGPDPPGAIEPPGGYPGGGEHGGGPPKPPPVGEPPPLPPGDPCCEVLAWWLESIDAATWSTWQEAQWINEGLDWYRAEFADYAWQFYEYRSDWTAHDLIVRARWAQLLGEEGGGGALGLISDQLSQLIEAIGGDVLPAPTIDTSINPDNHFVGNLYPEGSSLTSAVNTRTSEMSGELAPMFEMPDMSSREADTAPPDWNLTVPLGPAGSPVSVAIDWGVYADIRPVVHLILIFSVSIWAVMAIWEEFRRYG